MGPLILTKPRKNRRKQTWQSVPPSEIAHSELPVPLENRLQRETQGLDAEKNSVSPTDDKSSKKKKRDPWYTLWKLQCID